MNEKRNYHILRPASSHFRPATCEESDCGAYLRGWRTRVPKNAVELLAAARSSGRRFVECETEDGMIEFVFEPGQECFRSSLHRVPLDRPALHVIRDGRNDPRRVSAQGWHDDLGEHLSRIREFQEKG